MHRILTLLVGLSLTLANVLPARPNLPPLPVYYVGPDGSVREALRLAGFVLTDDPTHAQVLVVNGAAAPGNSWDTAALSRAQERGAGLLLFLGPGLAPADVAALLGKPAAWQLKKDPLSLDRAPDARDPILDAIQWNSAPQVRERLQLDGIRLVPLIAGEGDADLILGQASAGDGSVFVFTPVLAGGANPQIQQWSYFNYLVYYLAARAGGRAPLSFADYPGSPVPHAAERTVLLVVMASLVLLAVVAFALVRRYSRAHPELLDQLVTDRSRYVRQEGATGWEEVGFHRPLSGFLLAFMLGLLLFIPLIVYQNLILPVYILPSAQALGMWDRVAQLFNVLWLFFDMGTSVAFIKFLSQYRVDDPREGIQYGQLFVWWQAISGAVQVALVVLVSSTLVPRSAYALYAWSLILHALIQVPGFYPVFRNVLYGLQRFDYAQLLDIALTLLLPALIQPVVVTLMYAWGRTQPAFGAAMGGLLGMGIAAYAAEAVAFVLGWRLYRRLGFGPRVLFLAHFDWQVIKRTFRFGVFEMLGSLAWGLGQAAEIFITQTRLVNYAEIWGNWRLAQNFVFSFQVLQTLYTNLMPSISEAISHQRRILSQYYAAQAYRWGGITSAFIAAILLAGADRFILGASGPEFTRAAAYAVPLIVWGALQYPSWVGDNVQRAANRPYLMTVLVIGEQILRVTLAWMLLARFQISALVIAYLAGILAKDAAAYLVNHRLCFPQRLYLWSSLAAPALAGAVHYAILRGLGSLIWQHDPLTSILILFIGILPSLPLFAFLYALFGGWDDGTLEELRCAASLSGFMRPLAWLYWAVSDLGARLSPLHNCFPMTIRTAALAEAASLAEGRADL